MEYRNLLFIKECNIGIVTINRPKVLNSLNIEVFDELYEVFTEIEDDPDIRVAILTGSGDKAFVAGVDITEMKDKNSVDIESFIRTLTDWLLAEEMNWRYRVI
jgi:enoyl-CoA hydratase